jgi:hypothetical protein
MDFTTRTNRSSSDATLVAVKSTIQRQSRELVSTGRLSQQDLFFIRPERAQRAVVSLKA